MEKFLYWIRKCIKGNAKYCHGYCVTCPYFEKCKEDGVLD